MEGADADVPKKMSSNNSFILKLIAPTIVLYLAASSSMLVQMRRERVSLREMK
jgi:hypothetical protein